MVDLVLQELGTGTLGIELHRPPLKVLGPDPYASRSLDPCRVAREAETALVKPFVFVGPFHDHRIRQHECFRSHGSGLAVVDDDQPYADAHLRGGDAPTAEPELNDVHGAGELSQQVERPLREVHCSRFSAEDGVGDAKQAR